MDGIDRHDRFSSMYLCYAKYIKYWHHIFFRILESCLVNSYIYYNQKNDRISYFEFKSSVAISLMNSMNKKTISTTTNFSLRLRNKTSVEEKNRIVPRKHFPIKKTNDKGNNCPLRCEICRLKKDENKTPSICSDCKVPLCMNSKRLCFNDYHSIILK